MLQAQEEHDALTDAELLATSNLLLVAGHETTTNLIGNGTLALLRNPGEFARLRDDRSLLRTAIDEMLRYDSPVQATARVAREEIALGGATLPARALVMTGIGAANRDPEVFADPERFDVGRADNHHLSFGFGAHFCLGAPLARLEGEVAFTALLDRFPKLALASETVEFRANPILRGLIGAAGSLVAAAARFRRKRGDGTRVHGICAPGVAWAPRWPAIRIGKPLLDELARREAAAQAMGGVRSWLATRGRSTERAPAHRRAARCGHLSRDRRAAAARCGLGIRP